MDTEEVGVEDGCENGLLDADFGEDREELGCEIEVVVKEHEPIVHPLADCPIMPRLKTGDSGPVIRRDT